MKKTLILLVGMMLLASACTQETSLGISSDITSFQFDADGGSFDAIIFTNGSWTAACDDDAVVCSPASGDCTTPMHITVGPNEAFFTKSIRIELKTVLDDKSRTGKIVITQACRPFIFSEETQLQVSAEGGKARFHVNSNKSWKVTESTCDGEPAELSVDPAAHGPNRAEVTVLIPANPLGRERIFTVRLSLEEFPECSVILTVGQAA